MGILYNSSGLITKGMGKDQRMATQGYGGHLDVFAGDEAFKKTKYFNYNLKVPIVYEIETNRKVKIPLINKIKRKIKLHQTFKVISKKSLRIFQDINKKRFKNILDILKNI